ncbi:MAG TPA: hypothetical protein VHU14_07405 [Solirubrobacterales bacterium]|nr:hypothetical protein [Solirubrobacterales bacterium]
MPMIGSGCHKRRCATSRLALVVASAAALWALAAGAAAAVASPWTLTNLNLGAEETLFGMSCQPSGLCVGVGQQGVVVTSTAPTGGAGAWAISHVGLAENLRGNLRGVSCPSPSLCVAVDYSGGVYTTTEPAAGGGAWKATRIPKAKSLFGVSCTSPTQCVVVGYNGVVLTSSNPTGGAGAWTTTHLTEALELHAVTCTAAGGLLCVAGAVTGNLVTSTAPAGGPAAWTTAGQPGGTSPLFGLSCAGTSLCVAGNPGNVLVSTAPTAGSAAWVPAALPARFQILAASCPSSALCVLSSNNGEVTASTTPTAGNGAWATEHLIRGVTNALFGLSCPSETLCVAGGKFGQLLTTTEPAATGRPAPAPPKPPGTRLLHHPRALIQVGAKRRGAIPVAFRFGATGIATYFRCQLDQRRSGLCQSPKRYRVSAGNHVFRVRAFGPGGGDPTPIVFRFRVIKPKRMRT